MCSIMVGKARRPGQAHIASKSLKSRCRAPLRLVHDRRGSIALLGFVAMTAILGMAGFAIDLGTAYVQQARLQKVADSAAMAGAMSWAKTSSAAAATATIKAVVLANGYPATVIQAKPAILAQSPRNSAYSAVQVSLAAPVSLTFLRAITSATSVTPTAYAVVEAGTAPSAVSKVPTVFNTGVDASGNAIGGGDKVTDPHYTLTVVPSGAPSTIQIGESGASNYWMGAIGKSAWIGPSGGRDATQPKGSYGFKTTFDLTGYDPTTMQISGQIAGDDQVTIQLNSAARVTTNVSYGTTTTFSLPKGSGFIGGLNALTFYVNNTGGATGLRVDMSGTASPTGGKLMLVQ
jgi:Flp pilus assembly protein TadG